MAVNNWMHVPIDQMVSKPKIRGSPDLQCGVGELVGAQLATLSFSPKIPVTDWHKYKLHLAQSSEQLPVELKTIKGGAGGSPCRAVGGRPKGAPR